MDHCLAAAENVSSVQLALGDAAAADNTTPMQSGVLRLTAGVEVALTCTVTGGMPPPSVELFLNGLNITDQVRRRSQSNVHAQTPTVYAYIQYVSVMIQCALLHVCRSSLG